MQDAEQDDVQTRETGWLLQYAAGDDQAFHRYVESAGGRLFGFICRMLGNYHAAEDVYQTVLFRIASHAGEYDPRARLNTWVYAIARNACLDALRREGRRKTVELHQMTIDELPAPVETASDEELGWRIGLAVDALPEEQREVFLLKEETGLSFEEIGGILGCGKETAKSRMRYALSKLQQSLLTEARAYGVLSEADA